MSCIRWACVALALLGACGDDDEARSIDARARASEPTALIVSDAKCEVDGDRQVRARGVVRNSGEKPYHVNVSVRFLDGDDVRVDIASDSVSDLKPAETARWDASVYSDDGNAVERCDVASTGS